MANKIYVLSDLHGHFQALLKMIEKIQFDATDKMYILGDCCDRGPESLEIYYYLREHTDNMFLLKGNHEIMMRDAFIEDDEESISSRQWNRNGGKKTQESFLRVFQLESTDSQDFLYMKKLFYNEMIDYINSCPSYVEVNVNGQDYVLIHAGINPEKDLYSQTEEECAWMREYFFMSKGLDNKIIIFGHTPTSHLHQGKQSFDIWKDPIFHDKWGIDGGLGPFDKGQLNCLCLNTLEEFVIKKEELEEKYV